MFNWHLEYIEDGDMIPGLAVIDDSEQEGAGAIVAYVPQKYSAHGDLIAAAPALVRALLDVMEAHTPPGKMAPGATIPECGCQACKDAWDAIFKTKGLMKGSGGPLLPYFRGL